MPMSSASNYSSLTRGFATDSLYRMLGPGSLVPEWVEVIESREFGFLWGPVDEFEMLWLMDKCAFARWRVIPKIGEAELLRIAVEKKQRRSGLAKRLMTECTEYLAANGCKTLHLEVRVSNIPAQKLYESLGWSQISVRKAYYNDGEDALVYGSSFFE